MLSFDDFKRRYDMWETVLQKVRGFFDVRGYMHVRTPLLVRTPGMEPYLDPFEVTVRTNNPKQECVAGLITSPEFSMKKLLGAGFRKIYTVTPVFRNNEALGPTNIPEFTMLEWYAPGTYEEMMDETEALYRDVLEDQTPWPRLTFQEANVDAFGDPHVDAKRFFITHFPADQAALSRIVTTPSPSLQSRGVAGAYAERFESYADGLELSNGFAELTDPAEQRRRFERDQESRRAQGKRVFPMDEEFLESLGKIQGPVYGNSIGIDRLVMVKYGMRDINDIQLFPANERF